MIGLAIPCYKNHIPVLKRCLDSIEKQTRKPDLVVVSCSSSKEEDIPSSYTLSYSFLIKIITFEEKLNAAQNRNRAADILVKEGCTILSFFDCDDEMHPQRIQAIQEGFQKYPETKLLVHSFWHMEHELEEEFEEYKKIQYLPNKLNKGFNNTLEVTSQHSARVHHAQSSVSKDVFEQVKFNEEKWYGEDTLFCLNSLPIGDTLYIFNPLSKYYCSGSYKNELNTNRIFQETELLPVRSFSII